MKKTNGYIMAMAETKGTRSKKSEAMNSLKTLVKKIKGNSYTVTIIKGKVLHTELKKKNQINCYLIIEG